MTKRIDTEGLRHILDSIVAQWVREIGLELIEAKPGEVVVRLPVAAKHVHAGGVLCGQTMMAASDTAMVLAVTSHLGAFRPMTTVQLNTSFLRPVAGDSGEVRVVARVLRAGRNLVFGEIELLDTQGKLAAHSMTTYALL